MDLCLGREPFSVFGSYLVINKIEDERWDHTGLADGIYLRTAHGQTDRRAISSIKVTYGGEELACEPVLTPGLLRLVTDHGEVEITFENEDIMRLRGRGVGLHMDFAVGAYDNAQPYPGGYYYINSFCQGIQLMAYPVQSSIRVYSPWGEYKCLEVTLDTEGDAWEFALERFEAAYEPTTEHLDFEACKARWQDRFDRFYGAMPRVLEKYESAARVAAYVNWASTVKPHGLFQRPAMLMSKNWMTNVWSWDHAFNAMAMMDSDPDFAWDQLCIPFDAQHPSGLLPDSCNDKAACWGFTKPPVQGWALLHMLERGDIAIEKLSWFYPRLSKWTEYWFKYMDYDADGICQYSHGNDSGWDNCSCYEVGAPIEGPELSAYLAIQMEALSVMAARLGNLADSDKWKDASGRLIARLLEHSYDDGFFTCQSGTHKRPSAGDSLYNYLPVILGGRLPRPVFEKLAAGLKQQGRFLTPHGLATESLQSPKYDPDGYWRGPIWAPPMMMIIDGLRHGGEDAFALDLAERFCNTMVQSGFAENFNAEDGRGLRDPSYTWTSSVFLMLARMVSAGKSK